MSTLSLQLGNSVFDYGNNRGVSGDAQTIADRLNNVRDKIKSQNVSFGKSFSQVHNEIEALLKETSETNWDGYGAVAAKTDSYIEAQRFLNSFPTSLPLPEVSIDPDGEFTFEWYKDAENNFSISFNEESELNYAGLFGINKTHGLEYFGDEIPDIILEHIRRVYILNIPHLF